MASRDCIGPCGLTKPESEFYGASKKCKKCTLARQKELKEAKSGGVKGGGSTAKTSTPKKKASKRPAAAASADLTMPAGFGITCSVDDAGDISLAQSTASGDATIWLSKHEASMLQKWISEQLGQ